MCLPSVGRPTDTSRNLSHIAFQSQPYYHAIWLRLAPNMAGIVSRAPWSRKVGEFSIPNLWCALILVLMEDTHRAHDVWINPKTGASLNPCSNGRYSQSIPRIRLCRERSSVLILVLMEDTHRAASSTKRNANSLGCLNPCSNGRYSQRQSHRRILTRLPRS